MGIWMTSSCVGRFARACAVLVTASAVVAGLMPAGASSSASAGGTTSTVITQDVTSSQTWTRLGSPYLISSPIYVKSGAVLTIEPGVVVKFVPGNDSGGSNVQGLQVADGVLAARGTSEAPIVFTSVHDDTAGGDSDATNPRAPLAGDWMGLSFGGSGALEGASLLEHVSVRYAGWAGAAGCPYGGAIGVSGRGSLHVLRTEVVDTYATAVSVQKPVDGGTAATFEQLYVARAACGVRAVAGVVENSRIDDSVSVGWSTVNADGAALRYSWVGVPDPLGPSSTPMRASYSIYQTQLTDRSGIDFYNNNFFVRESNTYTGTNGPPMDLRWNWYSPSPTPLGACISDQDKPQLTYDASTYDPSCPTRFRSNGYRDAVQPFLPPPGLPPVGPSAAPYSRMDREAARGCAGCSFFHNEFQVLKAGPVNTATGQAMERRTDVSIPGPGVPAVWSRTYNGDDASSGPLGEGWSTDFTGTLTQTSDREVKVVEPTGAVLRFTRQGDGTYLPAPGIRAALVKQGDGTWRLTSRSAKRVWTYDAAGRLSGVSSLIGPAGLGVRLAYESGRLSRITDAVGRWMDLTYGATGAAEGKVTAVTTSDGRVVSYGYATVAGRPHLVSSTSPAGRVTTWSYDVTSGKLTGFTKPDGRSETDTYDAVTGRISKQVGPDGGTWTFDWTPSTKVSDGEGSGVATSTDPDGNVTKETYSGYVLQSRADGEGGVTRYAYDDDLRVASVTDPAGGVSSMTYDDRGNVLTRTTTFDATHAVTETWTYNGMDQPLTSTNGENETTSYRYNAGGLLADVVDPLDHTTHTDYNGLGLPTTITTPMGRATTMSYDALGNLVARTSPAGGTTRYEYTSAGLVGRTIAPRGNLRGATPADQERFSTWRTYDADGVLTTVTSPDDTTTAYTPDAQGNPVQAVTTDAAGQVIQKVDWTRNSAGEVLTRTRRNPTGAGQRVESFTYTPGGLLDTATDVLGAVTDNDYDHNHNLTRSTLTADGVARVTTYSYDAADRLVSTSDPTGAVDATRYDLAGRAVSVTAPSGAVTTFAYDDAGRLTSSAEQYDGGGTTTQTWDKAGRLIGRKLPGASAGWTYGYNDDGQMTSKTSPSGASVWSWTYTGDGQVDKATLPAGAAFITDYDYTADNLLKSVLDAEGGRTDYTYDPLGRVATATVKVDASRNTVTTTRYNATGTVKDVTVNGTAVLT